MNFTTKDILVYIPGTDEEKASALFTAFVYTFLHNIRNGKFINEGIHETGAADDDIAPNPGETHIIHDISIKGVPEKIIMVLDNDPLIEDRVSITLIVLPSALGVLFKKLIANEDWGKYR